MWISIAIMYILCFKLVITSGYMFDDMWSSVDLGVAINNDTTIGKMVLGDIERWVTSYGRILIFSFYSNFALNYLPLIVYKGMIVGAMFLDGLVLGGIIGELTDSKRLKYLTVLITLQCRVAGDSGGKEGELIGESLKLVKQLGSSATTIEEAGQDPKILEYIQGIINEYNQKAFSNAQK